jgi:mono/diheme cytochrome c family protein
VYYLAEAMAEGLVIGHGPMPEFTFTPEEIDDLLAYLHSVQLADSGVVADGLALATEDCAACHRVQESQPQPPAVAINETTSQESSLAPSFRESSRRDAATPPICALHPATPLSDAEQQFIPEELNAIVGYIVSLKDSAGGW